jgi:hypothetical protein
MAVTSSVSVRQRLILRGNAYSEGQLILLRGRR